MEEYLRTVMYYTINKQALFDRIFEEVSNVADNAYTEGGDSLYDAVILTEKDKPTVGRYIDDAVSAFVRRAFDICKYSPLVVYKQEVNGNDEPIYYAVENGEPTTTWTTEVTPYPVFTTDIASVTPRLVFYLPDFDASMEEAALEEVSNFIVYYASLQVFVDRRPAVVPQYTEKTQAASDKAIALLKSRKAPNEQW